MADSRMYIINRAGRIIKFEKRPGYWKLYAPDSTIFIFTLSDIGGGVRFEERMSGWFEGFGGPKVLGGTFLDNVWDFFHELRIFCQPYMGKMDSDKMNKTVQDFMIDLVNAGVHAGTRSKYPLEIGNIRKDSEDGTFVF